MVLFLLAILIINATDKISEIGYKIINSKLSVLKEEYTYDFNVTDLKIGVSPNVPGLTVGYVFKTGDGTYICPENYSEPIKFKDGK